MQQFDGAGGLSKYEQERRRLLGGGGNTASSSPKSYRDERDAILEGRHGVYMDAVKNSKRKDEVRDATDDSFSRIMDMPSAVKSLASRGRDHAIPTRMDLDMPSPDDGAKPASRFNEDSAFMKIGRAVDRVISAPSEFGMRVAGQAVDRFTHGKLKERMDDPRTPEYQRQLFAPTVSEADSRSDKVANALGTVVSEAPLVMGAYGATEALAAKVLPKAAPWIAKAATRAFTASVPYTVADQAKGALFGEEMTPMERAKDFGLNAAMFVGGDVALGAAGFGLKGALNKFKAARAARTGATAAEEASVPNVSEVLDDMRGAYDYHGRYNDLVNESNRIAHQDGVDADLMDVWASIRKPNDPTLAELLRGRYGAPREAVGEAVGAGARVPEGNISSPPLGASGEAVARRAATPTAAPQTRPNLPHDLAGAKPRYNRGRNAYDTTFESDVDKALYIVSRTANRSRRDEDYMAFLRKALPDMDDASIRAEGVKMRESLKGHSDGAVDGAFTVPDSNAWKRPEPAPQAAQTAARSPEEEAALREIEAGRNQSSAARPEGHDSDSQYFRNNPEAAAIEGIVTTYKKQANPELVKAAKELVAKDIDRAWEVVMRTDADGKHLPLSGEALVTGHELKDALRARGMNKQADAVVARMAAGLRESARGLQANRMFTKFSKEGAEMYGYNIKNRGVEFEKDMQPLTEAERVNIGNKIDDFQRADETDSRAIDLLDATTQKGPLNESQMSRMNVIRQASNLVRDAKQREFDAKYNKPKEPKAPREPREHKLLEKMKQSADEAEKRIRRRRNDLSSNPADILLDYAKIANYHVARKITNFTDFSSEMIAKLGDEVKPHLEKLYTDAVSASMTKQLKKLNAFDKSLQEAINQGFVTQGNAKTLRALSRELAQDASTIRQEALGDLQKAFNDLAKPDIWDKMGAYTTINMLLNNGTIERNILGNALMLVQEVAIKPVMGLVDATYVAGRKAVGKEAEREFYFRTGAKGKWLENWLKGGKYGWQGKDPDALGGDIGHGLRFSKSNWLVKNSIGYAEKALHAANKSFDYANANFVVNREMGRLAMIEVKRINAKAGIKMSGEELRDSVKSYMQINETVLKDMAKRYGEYATFQDRNVFSKASIGIKRGLNFGKGYGLGDVVNKFAQTSGSLIARTIDYSPLGAFKAMYQLGHLMKNTQKVVDGEISRYDFLMQGGRVAFGTAAAGLFGVKLSELGLLTGGPSADPKINNMRESMGMSPYSVNLSGVLRYFTSKFDDKEALPRKGDMIIGYGWAQPLAGTIGVTATVKSAMDEGDTLWGGIDRAASALMDISFLQGLHRAFDTNNGQGVLAKSAGMVAGVPATFIPMASMLRQVRRLTDGNKREYTPATEDWLANAKEQAMNAVPLLSDNLSEKRDYLGKESKYYDGTNKIRNAAESLMSPSEIHSNNPSPAMSKAISDYERFNDPKVLPSKADKSVTIRGNQVELSKEQYDRLRVLIGQNTEEMVAKYSKTEPNSDRAKIEKAAAVLAGAREKARGQVIKEYGLDKKK